MSNLSSEYQKTYNQSMPMENAFFTLSFNRADGKKFVEFCKAKQSQAASYLLSHEVKRDEKTHISVEVEIAWREMPFGAVRLGIEWGLAAAHK